MYHSWLTVNILEQWIETAMVQTPGVQIYPLSSKTKNTVSEFTLVLLQTTTPVHLNSSIQGLCQCAWVSLFEVHLTLHLLFATPVEKINHVQHCCQHSDLWEKIPGCWQKNARFVLPRDWSISCSFIWLQVQFREHLQYVECSLWKEVRNYRYSTKYKQILLFEFRHLETYSTYIVII